MCNESFQYLVYVNDVLLRFCLIVRFQFHFPFLTAQQQRIDVVLVDTAGRMQNNEPLMRSLAKVNIQRWRQESSDGGADASDGGLTILVPEP